MPTKLDNVLDPAIDVGGSSTQTDSLTPLTNESAQLGAAISGQTGSAASITNSSGVITVSGLTGMTAQSVGRFLTISGATTGTNNGTFLITGFNNTTNIIISNSSGVTDANNGSIVWTERKSYSLEDDLNYARTDRAAIKGVGYDQPIPTYTRCTDTTALIASNLTNIAGKTTDAKSLVNNRKYEDALVDVGDGYILITGAGEFDWADAIDRTGVPLLDGADAGNYFACYVEIINPSTLSSLEVLSGAKTGERIFGFTRAGTTAMDGYSVEVQFRSVIKGEPIANSTQYFWESGQPSVIDLLYGYRECLDTLNENALRTVFVHGLAGGGAGAGGIDDSAHEQLDTLVHNIAEDGYDIITRDENGRVSNVTIWTNNLLTTKIREDRITRDSLGLVSQIIEIQYDENGIELYRITEDIVRGFNSKVINIIRTRS